MATPSARDLATTTDIVVASAAVDVALAALVTAIVTIQDASHEQVVSTTVMGPHPPIILSSAIVTSNERPHKLHRGCPSRVALVATAVVSAPPGTAACTIAAMCLHPLAGLSFSVVVVSITANSVVGTVGPFDVVAAIDASASTAVCAARPLATAVTVGIPIGTVTGA
jgi:hypothetical protein